MVTKALRSLTSSGMVTKDAGEGAVACGLLRFVKRWEWLCCVGRQCLQIGTSIYMCRGKVLTGPHQAAVRGPRGAVAVAGSTMTAEWIMES